MGEGLPPPRVLRMTFAEAEMYLDNKPVSFLLKHKMNMSPKSHITIGLTFPWQTSVSG